MSEMQKKYTTLGLKVSTLIIIFILFLALIGTLFHVAIRGIPFPWEEIKEYFFKTDIAMWEVWLIAFGMSFVIGGK